MSVNEIKYFHITKHLYGSIRKFNVLLVHEPPYQNYMKLDVKIYYMYIDSTQPTHITLQQYAKCIMVYFHEQLLMQLKILIFTAPSWSYYEQYPYKEYKIILIP